MAGWPGASQPPARPDPGVTLYFVQRVGGHAGPRSWATCSAYLTERPWMRPGRRKGRASRLLRDPQRDGDDELTAELEVGAGRRIAWRGVPLAVKVHEVHNRRCELLEARELPVVDSKGHDSHSELHLARGVRHVGDC